MTDTTGPASSPDQPFPAGASPYDQGPYSSPPPVPPQPTQPLPPVPPVPAPLAGQGPGVDAAGNPVPTAFGAWSPFEEYATAPAPAVSSAPEPSQPAESDRSGRPRTGRTMALVVAAALIAGGLGGGIGAVIGANHANNATPASLSSPATTAPVKVNLPAGSVEAVAAKVLPSVVSIIERATDGSGGEGSGIVLSSDGLILTNNHVVVDSENGGSLKVTTSDGKTVDATIIGTDPTSDLAVIKAQGVSGLLPATLGTSSELVVGQTVVAVGSPLGLSGTVTSGIVSALNRPVSTSDSSSGTSTTGAVLNAIQTDAAINPGNSGGPLVDLNGSVVGINSAIASLGASLGSTQSGSIGLGFSIPIDQARRIAQELIKTGHATHPQLGVSLTDAPNGGATIASVTPGSPADKAGLKVGDVVTAVDGHLVDTSDTLVADIRSSAPGATVAVTYTRGGQSSTVNVTLGSASS